MSQNPTIQIPVERLAQLKAIARALGGLSIADTLGHLIRSEVARGTITDELPGVRIENSNGCVEIAFGDTKPTRLNADTAKMLSDSVQALTSSTGMMPNINDTNFAVWRRGNGVKVRIPFHDGLTQTFSRDVARDFARLVSLASSRCEQTGIEAMPPLPTALDEDRRE